MRSKHPKQSAAMVPSIQGLEKASKKEECTCLSDVVSQRINDEGRANTNKTYVAINDWRLLLLARTSLQAGSRAAVIAANIVIALIGESMTPRACLIAASNSGSCISGLFSV